jgi:5-formaminoimidazole-4-carboxamide-1-beta-D-ribofuranosyl 5'-monophosphate synthetase
MNKKKLPEGIINPFSPSFLGMWDTWKEYRWQEHKFKYKGLFSEQAALMKLSDVSQSDEIEAIEVIKESMANGWKGFFERKNKKNGQSNSKDRTEHFTKVQSELEKRIAARQQGTNTPHPKAV